MSYQVLARKWRPSSFDEVAGQEHVLRALVNALDNDRLHHAYLFTGTRGVGKTTLARILAKCLNCAQGVSSRACGECNACREISEGRFIDLIEVDAASRTKVEDTRELLDNVQYLPASGRFKVYLIDEVHMLSNHSFNALLKTLEEPPPHIKFLLATTNPQKLPVTILSRCLQFNLKNLSPERITEYLKKVLQKENIPYEEAAVWALARAADGSMRDALSLTDQAISYGDGKITEAELGAMLGSVDRLTILNLCRELAKNDPAAVLALVDALADHAPDYVGALAEMLSIWHRVAVVQAVPGALDNSLGDQVEISQLAASLNREDVQLFYQICLLGRRDLELAANPRSGFEMVLLRQMAFRPALESSLEPPPVIKAPVETASTGGEKTERDLAAKKSNRHGAKAGGPDKGDAPPASGKVELAKISKSHTGETAITPRKERGNPEGRAQIGARQTGDKNSTPVAEASDGTEPGLADVANLSRALINKDPGSGHTKIMPSASGKVRDAFNAEQWLEICYQLALEGRLEHVASNLALIEAGKGSFLFRLDESNSALYGVEQQQQLAGALAQYLGIVEEGPVSVVIEIAPVSGLTPRLNRLRQQAERQAKAIKALRDDPLVKELEQRFGGKIMEETVVPRG